MNVNVDRNSSIHLTQSSNTVVGQRTSSIEFHLRSHDFVAMVSDNRTATDTAPRRQINAITITKKAKLSTRSSHMGKKRMMGTTLIWGAVLSVVLF
jgi:hypothetical protein